MLLSIVHCAETQWSVGAVTVGRLQASILSIRYALRRVLVDLVHTLMLHAYGLGLWICRSGGGKLHTQRHVVSKAVSVDI